MNTIYFDSIHDDDTRRKSLYAGQIYVYSPSPAGKALCAFVEIGIYFIDRMSFLPFAVYFFTDVRVSKSRGRGSLCRRWEQGSFAEVRISDTLRLHQRATSQYVGNLAQNLT